MSSTKQRSRESESESMESKMESGSRSRASERSASASANLWARWVVYLVATLVTAYAVEFVWGTGSASFAVVMGVATGLAVVVADAIAVYA